MKDTSTSPPARALASLSDTAAPSQRASGFQRAADAMRMALPLVQRLLPLLDGNVGSAVSNLLSPRPQAPPPPPPINLASIEEGLAELQTEVRDQRGLILDQTASLQKIEEQLGLISEATDRNAIAQQEQNEVLQRLEDGLEQLNEATGRNALALRRLKEELEAVGQTRILVMVALGLVTLSIALNVVVMLHYLHVWR
ncbi:MAG: hypothetical protein ABSF70_05130 [Terracidiphilus sp.]|jgi:hypothetical protein